MDLHFGGIGILRPREEGKGIFREETHFRRGFIAVLGGIRSICSPLSSSVLFGLGGERRKEAGLVPTQRRNRAWRDLPFEVVAGFEAGDRVHEIEDDGVKDLFAHFGGGRCIE